MNLLKRLVNSASRAGESTHADTSRPRCIFITQLVCLDAPQGVFLFTVFVCACMHLHRHVCVTMCVCVPVSLLSTLSLCISAVIR